MFTVKTKKKTQTQVKSCSGVWIHFRMISNESTITMYMYKANPLGDKSEYVNPYIPTQSPEEN